MLLRREKLTVLRASHFHDTKEWRQLFNSFKKEKSAWRQLVDSFTKETIEGEVARYHRNCGSHSNIPPCCVEFYIRYWWGRVPLSWIGRIYRFLKSPLYPSDKIPAYVPCPKCLLKRHVQPLHECDGDCKPTGRVLEFAHEVKVHYRP